MKQNYAKIVVQGSPITKSNFKLSNAKGRAILPYNSGKYHDRYAIYEEEIAYEARSQNPGLTLKESLIALLKVYYKSQKRHPDTTNITKSIFDGIEKSGLIINDAQIRRLIIEEFYDKENPRFELELFCESDYEMNFKICRKELSSKPINYSPPSNKKFAKYKANNIKSQPDQNKMCCNICGKPINNNDIITANKGSLIICKECFKNLF
ncbi:RusA family crossover junction endodeoxyribonuclease [Clostridium fermenticellae]|uniref:RusA family crossover junction endodeoxyribonuclease n=1 Tax=Clostridium fermenticellae TaxID=2068654 RepID=A0A386H4Z7_9CLOT|nr:RusA family crossover junction endodeoxyribonuclease [Clostridium fermenticellae]AYD40792.1 RusA family crossover junction endodeoxyribonuclease [Clostridium fermenticellae]